MTIKLKYVGQGAALFNVPARDISDEEFAALSPELQAAALASGLYESVEASRPTRGSVARKEIAEGKE